MIFGGDELTQAPKEKIQVAVGNVAGISSVENNIQVVDGRLKLKPAAGVAAGYPGVISHRDRH